MKELLFRAVGLALIGTFLTTLFKKDSPSMAFAAALATIGALLFTAGEGLKLLRTEAELLFRQSNMEKRLLETVLKVTLTAILSKGASELCRDAGQSASAYFLELLGSLAALILAFPVFGVLVETISSMFR